MKSSAFILLIALVMASSVNADSCNHDAVYPPGCRSATDFHVCALDMANPNFSPDNSSYSTPNCGTASVDLTLFDKVHKLLFARPDVSNMLCTRLSNVFVLTSGSNDYGVWEVPAGLKPNGQARPVRGRGVMYIAVRPQANTPLKLADQENIMLAAALGRAPGNLPAGLGFESDDQPEDGMALLSILAHELGHLILAETNADGSGGSGGNHKRSDLCNKQKQRPRPKECFDNAFLAPTGVTNRLWNTATFHKNMRRWIEFGDVANRKNRYQSAAHELSTVIANPDAAAALLDGEFASLYAAVSPEEDFVETYKYKILADVAKDSNLRLRVPNLTDPVPVLEKVAGAAGNNLKGKIDCVNTLTP